MGDGVSLAATLYTPRRRPAAGGWPAVLALHGLGGNRGVDERRSRRRTSRRTATSSSRWMRADTARPAAQSSLVGPREVADYAAALQWLRLRPGVSDARVGALGFSLGGGSVWKLLTAPGTRLAAAVPVMTWTSLYDALLPQGLVKSGLIAYFHNLLPPERWDPAVTALRDDALQGRNDAAIRAVRRAALRPRRPRQDPDAGLHAPGPPRLRVRHAGGAGGVRPAARPEADLPGRPRPRPVREPGGRAAVLLRRRSGCGSTGS